MLGSRDFLFLDGVAPGPGMWDSGLFTRCLLQQRGAEQGRPFSRRAARRPEGKCRRQPFLLATARLVVFRRPVVPGQSFPPLGTHPCLVGSGKQKIFFRLLPPHPTAARRVFGRACFSPLLFCFPARRREPDRVPQCTEECDESLRCFTQCHNSVFISWPKRTLHMVCWSVGRGG